MFFVVDDDTMFRITVTWGELFDKIIETPGKRRCGPWSTTQRRRRRKKAMCNATMLKLLYNMEMKEEGTKEVTHRAGSYWTSCEYLDDASLQMLNHETKFWKKYIAIVVPVPVLYLAGRAFSNCRNIAVKFWNAMGLHQLHFGGIRMGLFYSWLGGGHCRYIIGTAKDWLGVSDVDLWVLWCTTLEWFGFCL